MPFDSSGVFNRVIPGGWQADRDANTKITAIRHDAEDDGFATGLSTTITRTGVSTVLADIPFNNKKITALGEPTNPTDAATKNYVDNFKSFTTGLAISGAGPINGFINFTSPSGVNGIGWATADMSWIGRLEEASKASKRLAVNDKADGTGTDVCIVDEGGRINNSGALSNNLSHDGTAWRTIGLGTGTLLTYGAGSFSVASNDAATTVDYQAATPREFFKVQNSDGNVTFDLVKTDAAAGGKSISINGYSGAKLRWKMLFGHSDAESGTRKGSNFYLQSYDNTGAAPVNIMTVDRETSKITFGGMVYSPQQFNSSSTTAIVSAASGGSIYFRPNGPTSTVEQMILNTTGDLLVSNDLTVGTAAPASYGVSAGAGVKGKNGSSGGYSAYWMNSVWNGSVLTMYANTSVLGQVAWQCDYRIKKNVKALPSTWEAVKTLRPISYQQKKYDIWESDDTVRWGFMAHELQEHLTQSAASGVKDGPDVQGPNVMVVVAALTKALQEAMLRIEALEARP